MEPMYTQTVDLCVYNECTFRLWDQVEEMYSLRTKAKPTLQCPELGCEGVDVFGAPSERPGRGPLRRRGEKKKDRGTSVDIFLVAAGPFVFFVFRLSGKYMAQKTARSL